VLLVRDDPDPQVPADVAFGEDLLDTVSNLSVGTSTRSWSERAGVES